MAGTPKGLDAIKLCRVQAKAYPQLVAELERVSAQLYSVTPIGKNVSEWIGKLYASFLHRVTLPDYKLYIHYVPRTGYSQDHRRIAERLVAFEPSTQVRVLDRSLRRKAGLPVWRPGTYLELALSTARRDVLEFLLEEHIIYVTFLYWILDPPQSTFPLETLRRLNLEKDDPSYLASVVQRHAGLVEIREYHGPLVFARMIPEDRIVRAAKETASEFAVPLERWID